MTDFGFTTSIDHATDGAKVVVVWLGDVAVYSRRYSKYEGSDSDVEEWTIKAFASALQVSTAG